METNLDDDVTTADENQNKREDVSPKDVRVEVESGDPSVCASLAATNKQQESVSEQVSASQDIMASAEQKEEAARRPVKIPEQLSRDIARIRAKFAANQANTLQVDDASEVSKEDADKEVPSGLVSRLISEMGAADVTGTEQVAPSRFPNQHRRGKAV